MSERKAIRRALISVYDKNRLNEIGKALADAGVEIISTGSTRSEEHTSELQSH